MIRFKEKEFKQWSICPATGEIFDSKTGEVQPLKISRGRPVFKGMKVHQIMAHTYFGYNPEYDVHHKDENKLNNMLSNLVYLTRSEHIRLHNEKRDYAPLSTETKQKLREAHLGKKLSDDTKTKISATLKINPPFKGKHHSEETKAKLSKPLSPGTKVKLSNVFLGRHLSEETRMKISTALKGKPSWNDGKKLGPRSEETKAKLRKAALAREAKKRGIMKK